MNQHSPVNLTNCDVEPIHIPGSIQPHGCLLACNISATSIVRHSVNSQAVLGIEGDLNGRKLSAIVGPAVEHDIRNALARTPQGTRSALVFNKALPNGRRFDIAVHCFKGNSILEFEPAGADIAGPLEIARAMLTRIAVLGSIDRLVSDTTRLVQSMLGYDRVMIYQFGADGAGKVISESRRADLESFLGQYFPASDIPQQARALYLKNTIRIISDADFERIRINPQFDASGEPLDLSFAHLRSVSPIHCEYLRNMGVGASMSISIIVDGALWGLIACHHYSPRTLTMAQRAATEMFGNFFSLHLTAMRHKQSLDSATAVLQALDGLLQEAIRVDDISGLLRQRMGDFAKLTPTDGIAMWLDGQLTTSGSTPPEDAIPTLARFAGTVAEGRIWATHKLSDVLPSAAEYATKASGMLIIPLSQRPRDYLFLFRKELVQTLDWGGNPEKTYESGPLGDRLTPRKSFAIWKETVHHQSVPWTEQEREFAEAARSALVGVILQHSELLADERAKAEVRQRMLNEELNHRVKNILAVIKSLVGNPVDGDLSLQDYVQSLRGRIQALSLAHDQVVRGEGGGALQDLLEAELLPYRVATTVINLDGDNVWMDARAFSIMALVLHELSTNAAKYGSLSRPGGRLDVSWTLDVVGACELSWVESLGPIVAPPSRRGFGTVLIDRSIPFDLGGESEVQYLLSGVVARFRIPPRFISTRNARVELRRPAPVPLIARSTVSLAGKRALIVEDQMLIALELEQMLEDAGLTVIATVTSSAAALQFLGRDLPDVAILDVNLGNDETSLQVAGALQSRNVPFIFATGYGDGILGPEFADIPVVRKPYARETIFVELRRLLS